MKSHAAIAVVAVTAALAPLAVGGPASATASQATSPASSQSASPSTSPPAQDPPPSQADTPIFEKSTVLVGTSAQGRPIIAERQGNPLAARTMLVIGQIHGNEQRGKKVVKLLRKNAIDPEGDLQLWTIKTMNPDGSAANTRHNARGVDLNRNFPVGWSSKAVAPGRSPASEPETRAVQAFLAKLRPDAVVGLHQPWNSVLGYCNPAIRKWVTKIGKLSAIPVDKSCSLGTGSGFSGTINSWWQTVAPGWWVTVEMAPKVSTAKAQRVADALLRVSKKFSDT